MADSFGIRNPCRDTVHRAQNHRGEVASPNPETSPPHTKRAAPPQPIYVTASICHSRLERESRNPSPCHCEESFKEGRRGNLSGCGSASPLSTLQFQLLLQPATTAISLRSYGGFQRIQRCSKTTGFGVQKNPDLWYICAIIYTRSGM